jgi:two-component system sensor histidine kinase KdpD
VPLAVRDRRVGVLRLVDTKPIVLDSDARRFLDALAYYAALGVERVRLTAAAERAEAFRQADELKTALLATVSHDLRTPLTTIKALAHQLAARGEEDALSIEEEADRLNGLVANLLDLSRLSAGELPLRLELDAVDDLVATTLDRLRGRSAGRTIRVARLDHDVNEEPILFARFDLAQSQRALVNLLENAIKYGPPDEPIELWIARLGDRVRLTVADRGPGIPDEEVALIFEPFYRPKGSRPDVGGAGLGLAIARRIAEAQGGSLTFAARAGGGSEFRFELPAGTAAELAYVHGHFMPDQP